jgi:hypothetical protein
MKNTKTIIVDSAEHATWLWYERPQPQSPPPAGIPPQYYQHPNAQSPQGNPTFEDVSFECLTPFRVGQVVTVKGETQQFRISRKSGDKYWANRQ